MQHSIVIHIYRYSDFSIQICLYLESCIPEIPSQGTVGASGDLAPLSHLAAGMFTREGLIIIKNV